MDIFGSGSEGSLDWGSADAAGSLAILGIPGASPAAGGVALGTGTGQNGFVPVASGTDGSWLASLIQTLKEPFAAGMSPLAVFALIGVILVSIIAWNFILYHIRIAAETV